MTWSGRLSSRSPAAPNRCSHGSACTSSTAATERDLAELLIDCEEDRRLRAVLVGMLRDGER
jgi:hypothetical protein